MELIFINEEHTFNARIQIDATFAAEVMSCGGRGHRGRVRRAAVQPHLLERGRFRKPRLLGTARFQFSITPAIAISYIKEDFLKEYKIFSKKTKYSNHSDRNVAQHLFADLESPLRKRVRRQRTLLYPVIESVFVVFGSFQKISAASPPR